MAKIAMYVADAALIAGAIALTIVTGGGGVFVLGGLIQMTVAQTAAAAMAMGAMGAGQLMSAVGAAMAGGGVASSQSVKNPAANRTTIYGQTRTNGTVIYMSSIGYVINQVVAWASHPCQSVDYIYLDGRELYFTGNGHNAVAGAQGFCDENTHIDPAGNKYNFKAGSNYHIAAFSTLGSYAGQWISQLGLGVAPPSGDHLFNADPTWTSNCTLNGICATWVGAASNATMFNNTPQVKAAIKGKCDIYDPRRGPLNANGTVNPAYTGWTDNAALIIADFLVNKDYGLAYTWTEINLTQLIAAANICDTQIPLAAGKFGAWAPGTVYTYGQIILDSNGRQQMCAGYYNNGVNIAKTGGSHPTWQTTAGQITYDNQIVWQAGVMGASVSEAAYTINGVIDWATSPGDTLTAMLEACAGRISVWNGQLSIYPGAWYGTTIPYVLGDIIDKVSFKQKKSRDLCNAVRAKYVCPSYPYSISGYDKNHKDNQIWDGQYQPTDAPEYAQDANHGYTGSFNSTSDINLFNDGGIKLYQDRSYSFVTSVGQCQRLMKIYLLRNRFKWSGTIRVNAKGLQNVPNDVISLTIPQYGFNNHLFEITEIRHIPKIEDGKAPLIYWELDLQETDPSCYTWSVAEERGVTNTVSPMFYDSLMVSPVTALGMTSGLSTAVVNVDGIVSPRINVVWIQPLDTFVTSGGHILVQYMKVGDAVWTALPKLPGDAVQVFIPGVISGQSYNVQVQSSHAGGATSDWVPCGPIVVSGDLSTNGYGLTTVGNLSSIVVSGPAGQNLLANPSFEIPAVAGTGDLVAGWFQQAGSAYIPTSLETNAQSYSGVSNLYLSVIRNTSHTFAAGSYDSSVIMPRASIPALPGQRYTASCMANIQANANTNGMSITFTMTTRVNYSNGSYTDYQTSQPAINGGWTRLSKDFTVATPAAPATVVSITSFFWLQLSNPTGSPITLTGYPFDMRVDNVCLIRVATDGEASFNGSTVLVGQGSIMPTQAVTLYNATSASAITVSWSAQSLYRSDTLVTGNSLNVAAGSQTWSSLGASTRYYFYPYVDIPSGTVQFSGGILGGSNLTYSMQANADGRACIPYVNTIGGAGVTYIQTAAAGQTGGGGGGIPCPEGEELVEEQTKGSIKVKDVRVGDWLKGYSFATSTDNVFREVIQTRSDEISIWRIVDGHKVSPCEPIYHEGEWKPAFQATGSTIDYTTGLKVHISLNVDNYSEQNYYLVSGTPLLSHNQSINS